MFFDLTIFQKKFKILFFTTKFRFLIGFLIIFIFQIWSTYKGEGVAKTYDSLQYLKAAQNLVVNQSFIQTQSYVTWALGFPFLLTFFKDSIFLNLLCISGIYAFYFDLIEKLVEKTITKWWLILAFAFATPLYLIHHFVWSEPPFLLFLIGSSWSFYYFSYSITNQKLAVVSVSTNDKHTNYFGFLFCLFGFLFMSMRNAGFYFVASISSGIVLFFVFPLLYKKKQVGLSLLYQNNYFKILLFFIASSFSSIFLWWLHAKPKTVGTFATMYSLAERTLVEECFNYGDILSRWLFPPSIPLSIRIFLLLIFVICMSLVGTRATVKYLFYRCSCPYERHAANTKFILFIFWITSFYLLGMLISRAGMKVDAERYLAILYPFLCILIGFVLDKMKINDYFKYGIAFLWLIYPILRTIKNIIFWN